MTLPRDLGPFVALVKGSLLATAKNPARRSPCSTRPACSAPARWSRRPHFAAPSPSPPRQATPRRFALASTQYVARYLHSPYASQFADAFVAGVIALNMAISHDKLADITSMMDPEREKVIYLRIARRAAIDGLTDLSTFASAKAEQGRDGNGKTDDPRALLYASLSTVTSDTIDEVRDRLADDRPEQAFGRRPRPARCRRAVVARNDGLARRRPLPTWPRAGANPPNPRQANFWRSAAETDLCRPVEGIAGQAPPPHQRRSSNRRNERRRRWLPIRPTGPSPPPATR